MLMSEMSHMSLLLHLLFFIVLNPSALATGQDQFVYSGFTGVNLTLDGVATVTPNGLLELTNGTTRLKGHAFHPTPFHFSKTSNGTAPSFTVSYVFAIYCVMPVICGHGMAFLVAASNNFSNTMPTQYLGLVNDHNNGEEANRFFAVELDTTQNDEFKDINSNHVGIDINGLNSVNSSSAGYYDDSDGNLHNLTLASYKMMQVWVEYNGDSASIDVTLAPLNMAKPIKPLLSTTHNLSRVLLTDMVYVGFSASTGTIVSQQYVLGWSFGMNRPAPAIEITKLPRLPRQGPKPRSKVLEIVLPIGTAAFVMVVGTIVVLFIRRRLRYAELRENWEVEFGPHRFSYKDLYHATEGFKNKNLLGVGGFGRVYRGVLPVSKLEIAVKRISHDSKQGMKEFVAEVVSIGRLQHRNLVKLHGYCRRKGELILVYEYMSNGSLDKYLHDPEQKPTLTWSQRFRIIKGIASGLLYLHEEWEKVVLHRDIKPSNVLLDDEFNGRLGDFGLARLYEHGTDPQTTHVVGTIGYLAPELARTSKATPLTDVFSFGMFILEVTCGRKPVNRTEQGNLMLVDWVLDCWRQGFLVDAVDTRLQGAYNVDEACLALKLGLLSSHPFVNLRPNMRQVMQYLNGNIPPPELNPGHMSFNMLSLMQNKGFDSKTTTKALTMTNNSMISDLSGGR